MPYARSFLPYTRSLSSRIMKTSRCVRRRKGLRSQELPAGREKSSAPRAEWRLSARGAGKRATTLESEGQGAQESRPSARGAGKSAAIFFRARERQVQGPTDFTLTRPKKLRCVCVCVCVCVRACFIQLCVVSSFSPSLSGWAFYVRVPLTAPVPERASLHR